MPVALGIAAGGWDAAALTLVVAWVAAYPSSWALTGMLAAPRPQRFRRAVVLWSAVAFARRRRERALANDLVLVAECTAMVPIVVGAAAADGAADGWAVPAAAMGATDVLVLTLACALALIGSTLHVKSLIRERRNPRFATASRWYAVAGGVVMVVVTTLTSVGGVLVVPLLAQAVRAFVVRDPRLRPATIGLVELACLSCWSVAPSQPSVDHHR